MSHFRRRHATHGGRETASKRRWRLQAFGRKPKKGARLADWRRWGVKASVDTGRRPADDGTDDG